MKIRARAAGRFPLPTASTSARRRIRRRQAQRAILEAVESRVLLSTVVVNTLMDETTPNSTTSLREAIVQANSGDSIVFGVNGTITLGGTALLIDKDLTITSGGVDISGNQKSRVFEIAAGANVSISHMNIKDGLASDRGGAISNAGNLSLSNMVISNSVATGIQADSDSIPDTPGLGGGIYNTGTLSMRSATLVGNTAGAGELDASGQWVMGDNGVPGSGGAIYNSGQATITNCEISGNFAKGGNGDYSPFPGAGGSAQGAAISNATTGHMDITNVTFTSNTATGGDGSTGGLAVGPGGDAMGGAIYNAGTLALQGGSMFDNVARGGEGGIGDEGGPRSGPATANGGDASGGAVYNVGVFTAAGTQFGNDRALGGGAQDEAHGGDATGGGIFNGKSLSLTGTTISGTATGGDGGSGGDARGGGIYSTDILHLSGSTVSSSEAIGGNGAAYYSVGRGGAALGGGIFASGPEVRIDSNTISGNETTGGGQQSSDQFPSVTGGNADGAGMFFGADSVVAVIRDTVASNSATGGNSRDVSYNDHNSDGGSARGAGIFADVRVNLTVQSSTIAENFASGGTADPGGATGIASGGIDSTQSNSTLSIANTIVALNRGASAADVWGSVASGGFNLIGNTSGSSGWTASDQTGNSAHPLDPGLGVLVDNGGVTKTMAPLIGSPALDSGNSFGLTADQRGKTRPVDLPSVPNAAGSDGSDIGAVEVQNSTQAPFGGSPFVIPSTGSVMLQAENFDTGGEGVAYHDTDAANRGGAYRTGEGVDIEDSNDAGGGYHVGYTRVGEWLEYTVNVTTSGSYDVSLRTAAAAAGGKISFEVDGSIVFGAALPDTGGSRTWTTTTIHGVNLTAGQHVLRLAMDTAASNGALGNFNWIQFTHARTPFSGSPFVIPATGPATLQAEDFDNGGEGVAYHDTEPANRGGAYRTSEGVDIEATNDTGGGYHVGYTRAGEWLDYTIDVVQTFTYDIALRTAAAAPGGRADMFIDGVNITPQSVLLPNTGTSRTWATTTIPLVHLTAGKHVLQLYMETPAGNGALGNFNWIRFSANEMPHSLFPSTATYAQDGSSGGTNFGSSSKLLVKSTDWIDYNRESFLKFDIPDTEVLAGARLRLYGSLGDTQDASVETQVFAGDSTSWNENTLTWNNRPSSSGGPIATATISGTAPKWYEWDISDLLQREKDLGHGSVTLILRNPNQSKSFVQFHSDDAASNRPEIFLF